METASSSVKEDVKVTLSAEEIDSQKTALLSKLGAVSSENKDDLKKISGVGPVLEGKLNEIGIYSFEQVSKMTSAEYQLLDSLTGTFPGRAERDDWAAQAKELMNTNDN